MSVAVDLITILLAIISLYMHSVRLAKDLKNPVWIFGVLASAVYLVAQTGWTAAYLNGSLWGAVYNNYIWFIFNTMVFLALIGVAKKH